VVRFDSAAGLTAVDRRYTSFASGSVVETHIGATTIDDDTDEAVRGRSTKAAAPTGCTPNISHARFALPALCQNRPDRFRASVQHLVTVEFVELLVNQLLSTRANIPSFEQS
jgi:hypothetical protein